MEQNEENFKLLAQYLQHTLSPDASIRRPGKCCARLCLKCFAKNNK